MSKVFGITCVLCSFLHFDFFYIFIYLLFFLIYIYVALSITNDFKYIYLTQRWKRTATATQNRVDMEEVGMKC